MAWRIKSDSLRSAFNTLTSRERVLITWVGSCVVAFLLYGLISGVFSYQKKIVQSTVRDRATLQQIKEGVKKHRDLRTKLDNLTTKYLNSSLTYEELTKHLDKIVKLAINSDNFDLVASKEKIELGEEFVANKFSIKIKQCSYNEALKMLELLEIGPPPVFLQKLDISKSYDGKTISAIFEIVSIQEKKVQ